MQLNIALLKAKIPYFTAIFISGMYLNYIFRGFLVIDLFTCGAISLLAVLKPGIFCMFEKAHEYDKYDFIDAFPSYLFGVSAVFIGFMVSYYLGLISLDFTKMISMILLVLFFLIVVDKSRYD